MFFKFRSALGLAVLLALAASLTVLAKGQFSFIAITGPGLEEEVRSTDQALTTDFFAFADFYRDKVEAPANPGMGYTITRYYIEGVGEIAFDQLHYYPETGLVFYDGIVNGDSEYDGEWYSANKSIKSAFTSAIADLTVVKSEAVQPAKEIKPAVSAEQPQPSAMVMPNQVLISLAAVAGLAILLVFVIRFRKPLAH